MPREKQKTTIGDFAYEVQQLGAIEGMDLYVEVMKVVGPTLASAVKGKPLSEIRNLDLASLQIDALIETFVEKVSKSVFKAMCLQLAATTEVWGPGIGTSGTLLNQRFDDHFAGRYAAMSQWLVFAVKVNLADFFGSKTSGGLGALVNLAGAAEASKSQAA